MVQQNFFMVREDAKLLTSVAPRNFRVPFIYLSEGVSNATFQYGLELASEAQVKFSGVLCGRATWKDGVPVFVNGGISALEDWLAERGIENIQNVNKTPRAAPHPGLRFTVSRQERENEACSFVSVSIRPWINGSRFAICSLAV